MDLLYPTWDKPFILPKWIRIMLSNPPNAATRYHNTPAVPKCPILPQNILSVCSIAELPVALPCLSSICLCPDVIPESSGKAKNPLRQNVKVHVWQHGDAPLWMLSTAFPL